MEEATLVLVGLHVDPVSCSNWTLEMLLSTITLTTASSLDAISKENVKWNSLTLFLVCYQHE